MTTNDTPSIWNKNMQDLTVKDNLKIAAGVTIVAMAAPVVIGGTFAAVGAGVKKLQAIRADRKAKKDNHED